MGDLPDLAALERGPDLCSSPSWDLRMGGGADGGVYTISIHI